jgi:hypothetical protein
MGENTKNEQPMELDEEYLQTITGGNGGARSHGLTPSPIEEHHYAIDQHLVKANLHIVYADLLMEAGHAPQKVNSALDQAAVHLNEINKMNNKIKGF